MEDAILLSTSPRRRGMETIKPGFFILSFAFAFALPRFTRLKCKRTRKCRRNKMKQFQWSCPVDYIKHTHHAQERMTMRALIIIFERRHRGCYYGFAPCLSRSPLRGTSFGWYVFYFSSCLIPNKTLSRVCIFHPEEAASFPNLI